MPLRVEDMLAIPFYCPVVEEGTSTARQEAAAKLNARVAFPHE
jgi:hypothetical protein